VPSLVHMLKQLVAGCAQSTDEHGELESPDGCRDQVLQDDGEGQGFHHSRGIAAFVTPIERFRSRNRTNISPGLTSLGA
jgi:hypothetical protein